MRPEVRLQGFPKRYKDAPECTGDGWLAHYKAATPVIETGGILVLYGGHGTGKTRMAHELARKAKLPHATCKRGGIDVDLPLIYTTAVNLFMSLLPIPLDAVPRTAAANLTIAPRGSPPHRPPLPP